MELTDLDLKKLQDTFIELLESTKREGIDKLIKFLKNTDFFTAPASTRFHGSYKGGLLVHSLNVYECLKAIKENEIFGIKDIKDESLIICALLHDICKTLYYSEDTRNVKNKETGKWEQVPFFQVENQIVSCGEHGDKSIAMVSQYIKLSPEEMAAIRWHMGAYEGTQIYNTLGLAFERYPLSFAMHVADQLATHRLEVGE